MNYAQDGDLSNFEPEDIADAMMWDDDPQRLVDALVECGGNKYGFLEFAEDGGLRIHDWMEHGGKYLENQQKDAERKRQARQKDVQRMSGGQAEDVQRMSDVRKEEKRKEEKRRDTTPPTPPSQGGGDAQAYPPDFERFWTAYPRRVEKRVAYKAWLGVVRHGADPAELREAAEAYRADTARKGTPQDKIKHAATFMHEDRWRDWLPPKGAAYLESLSGNAARGRDSPEKADIPRSYEEAVRRYRRGGAIDIDAVEVAENDTGTGLQAVC